MVDHPTVLRTFYHTRDTRGVPAVEAKARETLLRTFQLPSLGFKKATAKGKGNSQ